VFILSSVVKIDSEGEPNEDMKGWTTDGHGFTRMEELEMKTQDAVTFMDSSAKICGHPRSSAFSKCFNANGREYPQMAANHDR
jgi:hypothetical protein